MSCSKTYDIYGIGNALLDKVYNVDDAFLTAQGVDKGVMTLVDKGRMQILLAALANKRCVKEASGGSVANAIIVANHFGTNNFLSVCLADDANGNIYLNDIHAAKVSSNYDSMKRQAGFSGVCLAMVTEDADRTLNSYLGISESLSVGELNIKALQDSHYFFIEGYLVTSPTARKAVLKGREVAKKHGVKTALSLSDPFIVKNFRDYFELFIGEGVDLLFCNEEEAKIISGGDLTQAKETLKKLAKQFVVTLGEKGALLYDGRDFTEIKAKKVNAIDTNGAGDMFAGAFLYALSHDLSFTQAGMLAREAAGRIVSQYGPRLLKDEAALILQAFQTKTETSAVKN